MFYDGAFIAIILSCFFNFYVNSTLTHVIRFAHDPFPKNLNHLILKHCTLISESTFGGEGLILEKKREFLIAVRILEPPSESKSSSSIMKAEKTSGSNAKSKEKGKQKGKPTAHSSDPVKVYSIYPTFDFFAHMNYPACTEALELTVPSLSAQEVLHFANTYPTVFYTFSPTILEAIPDYSAFSVAEIKKTIEYVNFFTFLNIESAIKTLPIDSVIYLMAHLQFVFPPTILKNLEHRQNELSLSALDDPRLLYQYFLVYFNDSEFKSINFSISEFLQNDSSKTVKAGGKKSSIKKSEDEIGTSQNTVYGNLIDVNKILNFAEQKQIPANEFIMLAFSYAIYTDILLEMIFDSFRVWAQYVQSQAEFLIRYEKYLSVPEYCSRFEWNEKLAFHIKDLKRIISARKELISAFELESDENSSFLHLLSVPLSFARNEELKSAFSSTHQLPSSLNSSSPFDLATWLWSQLMTDYTPSVFPFKFGITSEIVESFNKFGDLVKCPRFCSGLVSSRFFEFLLQNNPTIPKEILNHLLNLSEPFVQNFGNLRIFDGDRKSDVEKTKTYNTISNLIQRVFYFYHLLKQGNIESVTYIMFVMKRRNLENALYSLFSPNQIPELIQSDSLIDFVLTLFPEILGFHNLHFLASHNLLSKNMIKNLPPTMVAKLLDVINFDDLDNLDGVSRGLIAVPPSKIGKYLEMKNFRLEDPVKFIRSASKYLFFKMFEPSSESNIKLFNMLTPFMAEIGILVNSPIYQLPEAIKSFFEKEKNVKVVYSSILSWLIMREVNFMKFKTDYYQIQDQSHYEIALLNFLTAERTVRRQLLDIIAQTNDYKDSETEIMTFLSGMLRCQTVSPTHSAYLQTFASNPQFNGVIEGSSLLAPLDRSFLESLIERLIEDEDERFELILINRLSILGSSEQSQLPSEVFVEALQGSHGISKNLINLIQKLELHYRIEFNSEFVRVDPAIAELELMAVEDKEGKRLRIAEKVLKARMGKN